jgi:hypothetical protein
MDQPTRNVWLYVDDGHPEAHDYDDNYVCVPRALGERSPAQSVGAIGNVPAASRWPWRVLRELRRVLASCTARTQHGPGVV